MHKIIEKHDYSNDFFDYINAGSLASARVVAPIVFSWLHPESLLDVGCGAGAWCKIWSECGIGDHVTGTDGNYVDRAHLLIPPESFHAQDLTQPFDLNLRFDLVTSLEVAEHIPEQFADVFVDNLVKHGDVVLFSAAVPGQGGEFHVNEQPLGYWRKKFAARAYRCFDPIRPRIAASKKVEPWYRYNTLLYIRDTAVKNLPQVILDTELTQGRDIPDMAPLSWNIRNAVIRILPSSVANQLVKFKHAWMRKRQRR
jgi:hypothetical protein